MKKPRKKAEKTGKFIAKGVNASPGAAVGQAYFDADTAEKMAKEQKQDTIMVRPFTKPDDVSWHDRFEGCADQRGRRYFSCGRGCPPVWYPLCGWRFHPSRLIWINAS